MTTRLSNLAVKSDYATNTLMENILCKMFRVPVQMFCSQAQQLRKKRKAHKYPFSIFKSSFLYSGTSWEWLLCIMVFLTREVLAKLWLLFSEMFCYRAEIGPFREL